MAIELNLFYSEETQQYYWIGKDTCEKCNKPIIHVGFLLWDYWRTHFRQCVFCYACKSEISKAGGKYTEFKRVFIVPRESIPASGIGIFPERPELSNARNVSVYDVADKTVNKETVVDRTLIGRESWQGAMIGSDVSSELDEKDRLLSFDEADKLLLDLKEAEPLESRFELEDKKEKKEMIE